jgi:beta-glucanase (GH16 family)
VCSPIDPIPAGESATIIASFADAEPRHAGGNKKPFYHSNKTKAVVILANGVAQEQAFELESIRLEAPVVELPEWVGKRPPVEGDWTMTFNEEFEGDALDRSTWNVITANFWDKVSRFSKDNVNVKDGDAILTFEKRRGHHGDDPEHPRVNDYTTGYLDTYGKWVQRYGYYECRMKLPTEEGLWPAFWLMPDRGLGNGEQWQRASINEDAIEFDIMEFLSGWGPHRFTTAYHYDGYGKDHKATGAGVYTAHDEQGYITTGLLWLPGLSVIYNNGREVSRWESDRISTVQSYIIFTFVAGGWDNTQLTDQQLPATFEVDYVRVWQRADLASEVDGVQSRQETLAAPTEPDSEE